MEKTTRQRDVQQAKLEQVAAILGEHFEQFVVVAVPGGGGEPYGAPVWRWNGNRLTLAGSLEALKLSVLTAQSSRRESNDGR